MIVLRCRFRRVTVALAGAVVRSVMPGSLGGVPSSPAAASAEDHPGQRLGLPAAGRGSLASWRARVAALLLDWAASMAVSVGLFGTTVLTGSGWQAWMTLVVFFLESTVLVTVASGSFGQLICRIAVVRLDTKPVGFPRAILRQALVSMGLPPLIIGPDRRGLQDLAANTVVVNRR